MKLHVDNVTTSYLQNISFEMENENVVILGSNGAGKTTLSKIIVALEKNNSVYYEGEKISSLSAARRCEVVNFIPSKLEVFDDYLDVEEFLQLSLLNGSTQREMESVLGQLGIEHLKSSPCKCISSGESQLVLFASGLLHNAELTIFDEPTANLDSDKKIKVYEALKGSDMVFVTAGMGGGTGTGASPIVAEIARDQGSLVVGIVTKPFTFEGFQRARLAEEGLNQLSSKVDTILVIPNDKVISLVDKKTPLVKAFKIVDEILNQAVQGISDLITVPGIVNVDFADVKAIMQGAGPALMGVGKATGENRAVNAAKMAINSPLLEISIHGASAVLFNVSGGADMSMNEVNEAARIITESIDPTAKVIFGAAHDHHLKKGELKVTVVATGFTGNIPQLPLENSFDVELDSKNDDNLKKLEQNKKNIGKNSEDFEDDTQWDVPAFLRRNKK